VRQGQSKDSNNSESEKKVSNNSIDQMCSDPKIPVMLEQVQHATPSIYYGPKLAGGPLVCRRSNASQGKRHQKDTPWSRCVKHG
jgi:hypothetical protein